MTEYVWISDHVRVTREQTIDHWMFRDKKYCRRSAYLWLAFETDLKVHFTKHKANLMQSAWNWPRVEMVYRFLLALAEFDFIELFGDPIPVARKGIPKSVKDKVYKRDGKVCRYCGCDDGPFQLDHVYPYVRGGQDTVSNLVVACRKCNLSKGFKTLKEWQQ